MNALDIHSVLQHIPHRFPFLLIDKVLDYSPNETLVGVKNVTINEPFFTGHFPSRPVMPGVLIVESLAQAACVLAFVSAESTPDDGSIYLLTGINKARFKRIVQPGDQLMLNIEVLRVKRDMMKILGVATVDDEVACTAEILCFRKGE